MSTTLSQLESRLWESTNIPRRPVDAADFKSYVFPIFFFKRISDVHDEEHPDTFLTIQHSDLFADTATRVRAKPKFRSPSAGLLRSEGQLLANPSLIDSDTPLRDSAFAQSKAALQALSEANNNTVARPGQLFYSTQIHVPLSLCLAA